MESQEPRGSRTAVLEAAISELQAAAMTQTSDLENCGTPPSLHLSDSDLEITLRQIERRLEEQEQSLRHVLTMLIEWLEDDPSRKAA